MANLTVKVEGLSELGARMKQVGDDMKFKFARSSTYAGAKLIQAAAIAAAPQSSKPHRLRNGQVVEPGNLKRNIVVIRARQPSGNLTEEYFVGVRRGSGKPGKDAYYAGFVEFGTVKSTPKPFLGPALHSAGQPAIDAVKAKLTAAVKKAGA